MCGHPSHIKLDISKFLEEVAGRQNAIVGRCLATHGLPIVIKKQALYKWAKLDCNRIFQIEKSPVLLRNQLSYRQSSKFRSRCTKKWFKKAACFETWFLGRKLGMGVN